jgi:signal peptidase I
MEPALAPGDRLLCSRRAELRRGAIVVRSPGNDGKYFIKRLVALPGDERRGAKIPAGACWIEGDNVSRSADSRHFGPVPVREIRAVAFALIGSRGVVDLRSVE